MTGKRDDLYAKLWLNWEKACPTRVSGMEWRMYQPRQGEEQWGLDSKHEFLIVNFVMNVDSDWICGYCERVAMKRGVESAGQISSGVQVGTVLRGKRDVCERQVQFMRTSGATKKVDGNKRLYSDHPASRNITLHNIQVPGYALSDLTPVHHFTLPSSPAEAIMLRFSWER